MLVVSGGRNGLDKPREVKSLQRGVDTCTAVSVNQTISNLGLVMLAVQPVELLGAAVIVLMGDRELSRAHMNLLSCKQGTVILKPVARSSQ